MRLGRILIIVGILGLVLLVLVFALSNSLSGGGEDDVANAQATADAQLRPAVVLLSPIDQGERITIDKLDTVDVHPDDVNEFTFAEITQVEGLYARVDLNVGDYLQLTLVTDNPLTLIEDLGSSHAALIPAGMVAFPIPISRFSSVAYGISRGDHVNVIATLTFVDMDTQFQTLLPNLTSSVLGANQQFIISGSVSGGEGQPSASSLIQTGEIYSNLVAQSVTGGPLSPQGRAELDTLLNEPFYLVPSEVQRPRLISQSVMFNKVVLHVGAFPLVDRKGEPVAIETEVPVEDEDVEGSEVPEPPEIVPPDIVTLIVSPQESVALNYLIYSGAQLTLALRAKGDDAVIPTDAVSLQYLMDVYRIPLPVKLPYGINPSIDVLEPPVLLNDIPQTGGQ